MRGFAQAWLLATMPELPGVTEKRACREDSLELEIFAAEVISDLIRFQKCLSREDKGDRDFCLILWTFDCYMPAMG